jgi:hypothetical protein
MREQSQTAAPGVSSNAIVIYCHVMTLLLLFAILTMTVKSESALLRQVRAGASGEHSADGSHSVRYRPRSARQTPSPNAPPHLDEFSASESIERGIGDLEGLSGLVRSERCRIALRKEHFIDGGRITDRGRATLRIISAQLQRFNGHAQIVAPTAADASALIPVCLQIASETGAYPGSFGVSSRAAEDPGQREQITIVVTRDIH